MALRARISENPWDVDAWAELAHEVASSDSSKPGALDEQRGFYEELLNRFPTAVRTSGAAPTVFTLAFSHTAHALGNSNFIHSPVSTHGITIRQ